MMRRGSANSDGVRTSVARIWPLRSRMSGTRGARPRSRGATALSEMRLRRHREHHEARGNHAHRPRRRPGSRARRAPWPWRCDRRCCRRAALRTRLPRLEFARLRGGGRRSRWSTLMGKRLLVHRNYLGLAGREIAAGRLSAHRSLLAIMVAMASARLWLHRRSAAASGRLVELVVLRRYPPDEAADAAAPGPGCAPDCRAVAHSARNAAIASRSRRTSTSHLGDAFGAQASISNLIS